MKRFWSEWGAEILLVLILVSCVGCLLLADKWTK